jgi:hypothetical protein
VNRLQLVQDLIVECGVSGTLTTLSGVTGEFARLAGFIDKAWQELQTKRDDWNWMLSSNLLGGGIAFQTIAGQASYPLGTGAGTVGVLADNFGKWKKHTFRNYTTTVGFTNESHMDNVAYDTWRNGYMFGAMRSVQTRPVAIAIGPDESLCLGPPPNSLYTVTGDYFVAPTVMVADTDLPINLPTKFHRIIVYAGMVMYAGYEAAPEVMTKGQAGYELLLSELEAVRTPEMRFAGALA